MFVKISRRNLFRLRPVDVMQLVRRARKPETADAKEVTYFRPPGALSNAKDFLTACERCAKCSEACPHGVIEHLGPVAGDVQEGTPVLYPDKNPCHWCSDMPCIQACPSGALAFRPGGIVPPIGKAVLHLNSCLTLEGILCDMCSQFCPTQINAITMKNRRPHLDENACVGCGLCACHCESSPPSLRIVPWGS